MNGIPTGRTRRAVATAAAASLIVLALSACGPSIGGSTSSKKLEAPTGSDPHGTITIWDRTGDLYKVFDSVIAKFNKVYPHITVNHVAVDTGTKLAPALTAGAGVPDGSFVDDSQIAALSPHLYDLSDLMSPYESKIAPQKYNTTLIKGASYAIPWDLDPGLLFYRADILKQDGIDPDSIKTYDDLLNAAKTVKQHNPDAQPIHFEQDPTLGQLQVEMFANQLGTSMADADGKLRLDSSKYKKILGWMQSVSEQGLASHTTLLSPSDITSLENGNQVFVPFGIWWDFAPQQLLPKTKGDWRAMPLPAWSKGGQRSGALGGSSFVIPAAAKNPQLAWLFYKFLVFSKEGYTTVYGPNSIYPNGLNTSIPSYLPALTPTPLFGRVEGLGNQDIYSVAVEAGKQIPARPSLPIWWPKSVGYFGNNIQKLMDNQMTASQVITTSTQQIQTNLIDRSGK